MNEQQALEIADWLEAEHFIASGNEQEVADCIVRHSKTVDIRMADLFEKMRDIQLRLQPEPASKLNTDIEVVLSDVMRVYERICLESKVEVLLPLIDGEIISVSRAAELCGVKAILFRQIVGQMCRDGKIE